MDNLFRPVWELLTDRATAGGLFGGPVAWRLIFQPATAAFLAVRAGLQDARAGRPPFGWAVLTDADHRRQFLGSGWKDIARVFILASAVELIYEGVFLRGIYPGQLLLVASLLALLPYLLLRGPVNRIAQRLRRGGGSDDGRGGEATREPRVNRAGTEIVE
jgi:hypothetical protein